MQKEDSTQRKPAIKANQRCIIAIGASAGGLEAIHEFFDNMPPNSGFTFVVIQHLSPDYKSLLVELVSKHTHMKVFEATHDMDMQRDCVYIIPNKKLMTVKGNKLKLVDKLKDKSPNTAIDTFLVTLAKEKKDKAIAIILSGTGTDGTKGIEMIKECGGMVMVQDPSSARFDGMPNSAITSGNADFILPPAKMHTELYNYVNQDKVKGIDVDKPNDHLLEEIFTLVHSNSGHDFNLYKTPTILRRISRRMTALGITELKDYVEVLKDDKAEIKTLGKDFLIGVTKFFRDKGAWELMTETVLPEILKNKVDGEVLKVWICACSTGEEAYTAAILINDCLQKAKKNLEVKIFATDIDESSIDIAAKNAYPLSIAKEIPAQLLKKYFIKEGKQYSVLPAIRKQIVFARHNVIKSPPFIKNDLITCRNMLIYMNGLLQQKVLSTFHFALSHGGFLMLGSSETASVIKDGFTELSSKWKLYQKTGSIHYSPHNTYSTSNPTIRLTEKTEPKSKSTENQKSIEDDFREFVLEEFSYVGIFIDKNYEVKETIGNFRQYLSLPDKKLELNILRMVPHEISILLNTAIRKAWKEKTKTHLKRIRLKNAEEETYLNISVKPPDGKSSMGYTLVLFSEHKPDTVAANSGIELPPVSGEHQSEYLIEMEAELNETRHNLQMAVEEMETTNEELQSSNEELLSANEELQSSNEELQSLNEELHTLNTEHQLKIKELIELNDDLDNYFRSTDIGQVFIDANLRIRKFNPAAVKMINLIEADIGRPINHISSNIRYENLIADIHTVLAKGNIIEKEIEVKNGASSLMRIMPYLRKDNQQDGAVISFVDISVVTELNNIIAGVFNANAGAILAFKAVRNTDRRIVDFKYLTQNNSAVKMFNIPEPTVTGGQLHTQFEVLFNNGLFEKYSSVVETGKTLQTEIKIKEKSWYQLSAVKMADGFVVNLVDVTDRKTAEQKLRKNYNELITTREELRKLNNDLEDKISDRTRELSESEERFKLVSQATNDTIWDWNLVNNTMWRNDNFSDMFGYQLDDESRSRAFWMSKIHPDDVKGVEEGLYRAINSGEKQWTAEYRFLKADNTYATILDRGSILADEFNVPYRMVGSVIDITRLVEAEQRISRSEDRFKKVFASNMIGMLFCDADGRIIEANDAYLDMIGYTKDELLNDTIRWSDITPPEFMAISKWAVKQIKEKGVSPPFEKQYIRKNGKRVSVLMGTARLEQDSQAATVSYIIDITKQKEADKRRKELQQLIKDQQDEFYSIFMNAPALIAIKRGPKLVYEFVNEAFKQFYGDTEYIGKPAAGMPGITSPDIERIEKEVYKTGNTHSARAFHIENGGSPKKDYWFDFIYTPVFAKNGKVDGIAFFGFDVTDLVKGQQATRELMQKKDEFLSIASHELKTPITSLKGSIQIVQRLIHKNGGADNISPFIEKAGKQTGRLTALVEDLLDVTRIQGGKMLFNYSTFNAAEMIHDCADEIESNTGTHKIEVEANPEVQIYADRPRLEQVINNFLLNAIKYSPDSNRVIIKSEVKNGRLKVSVTDFGIGIPENQQKEIFNRFFRVQGSSHKFSGLGLGLYISSEIIGRHKGTVGVESVEDEGSTFWFSIPLDKNKV